MPTRGSPKKLKNENQAGITALYNRVSTDAQFEEGYSLDAQEEKLKKWCELKDISNYEVYTDGGWSGSNLDRPEIQRLITDIMNHKIERVVVYKLDRLSRSQKDTLYLLEDVFIPNNVDFVSLNENFDTSTPYGKAMIGILSVFAQLERENIRERTRMGMHERVKNGLWMGGHRVPFGYDYDPNQDILVPNKHADDVRSIYELYLKGYSTTQLSQIFPVCSDRQVAQILDRATYIGKIYYNGEILQGKHEPIISKDVWERVQTERQRRSTKNIATSSYLLSGFLVCGKCGAKMRYQKWGKKGGLKIYCYSQQTSKKNLIKDPNCDNLKYDASDVEEVVLNDLFKITDNIVSEKTPEIKQKKYEKSSLKVLQQKYDALNAKIKRLYNLYAENGSELLLETIQENQMELSHISKILENEKTVAMAIAEATEQHKFIKNLRNKWSFLTIQEKRKALRICIEKIVITDGAIDVYYLI